MQPLNDYVIVKRVEKEEKGLIVVSADAKADQPIGRVIAVGPGRLVEGTANVRTEMSVQENDIVLFYENASQKVIIDEQEYYAMTETNIFVILEKAK